LRKTEVISEIPGKKIRFVQTGGFLTQTSVMHKFPNNYSIDIGLKKKILLYEQREI